MNGQRFSKLKRIALYSLGVLAVLGLIIFIFRESIGRRLIVYMTPVYQAEGDAGHLKAVYTGKDSSRQKIAVQLLPVGNAAFVEVTDIQFIPGDSHTAWVACKSGKLYSLDIKTGQARKLADFKVSTESEQGLLGLAFHPDFKTNGKVYLNLIEPFKGDDYSHIVEVEFSPKKGFVDGELTRTRVLLQLRQPYQNHNAGQLQFGPDGMLYVPFGDGGLRDDPGNHGQNTRSFLGAVLRIDVNTANSGYKVPHDNPFVSDPKFAPEIWAWGFRNPWRFSFDSRGRLIAADVGQDKFEEISIVVKGKNYGWKIWEATHCFEDKAAVCAESKHTVKPVYEYGRSEGQSITGGYEYTGSRSPSLKGLFLFGDFISGRLWAIRLPDKHDAGIDNTPVFALGKWPLLPSTFGRSADGEVYVGDFDSGRIYRIQETGQ